MRHFSTLTTKGQTTVPREIREYLQVGPRQRLAFVVEEGKVVVRAEGRPLSALAGSVASGRPMIGKQAMHAVAKAAAVRRFRKSAR